MLAPVRLVAPATNAVTLAEAKAQCRVEASVTEDDALITGFIEAATAHLDGYTGVLGRALVTQSWRQDFCGFSRRLRLPLMPVASIITVTWFDAENVEQTLDDAVYGLFVDDAGAYVGLKPDQSWPGTYGRPDAVSVTYAAGVDAAAVPRPLKQAILLLVGHWYLNREAVSAGGAAAVTPLAVEALIAPYRRIGV